MKVALCFIISYEHILNKEHIWREWIEQNKDMFNIYFYYKDITKIKSDWILNHALPSNYIFETTYLNIIPAYLSIFNYALNHDINNKWFCLLTDSCCPIISPKRFKYLFYENYNKSIFSWKKAWWNIYLLKRANLKLISEDLRLGNDPWFILKRENIINCLQFVNNNKNNKLVKTICSGGVANESLFAIILYTYKQLKNVICMPSHITDWSRMTSSTSPHVFKDANTLDIQCIEKSLKENKYSIFLRKVDTQFPDTILNYYIYEYTKKKDEQLVIYPYFNIKIFIFSLSFSLSIYGIILLFRYFL